MRPIRWPVGQKLSTASRALAWALTLTLLGGAACSRSPESSGSPAPSAADAPRSGGTLVSSVRAEPRGFNRYVGTNAVTELCSLLMHAKLLRVNRVTDQIEPMLAERWDVSADGLTATITLRPDLTFSDGAPLTADDVLFSFRVMYDEQVGSQIADALKVNHRPLDVTAPDSRTIVIRFPATFGPGLRLLDNLPVFPRHRLEAAYKAGQFAQMWGVATPPAEIVGAGPFVLSEYRAGERLVFTRNTHYFKRDARGVPLPYLDRLVLDIVPDQDAELVRLQAGQLDTPYSAIRPSDYLPLRKYSEGGKLRIEDLGTGIDVDGLFFSLKPKPKPDPRTAWMQHEDFRHAISLFVDRQAFADAVYFGAATPVFGPVTPGNTQWYAPEANQGAHDVEKARALLRGLNLSDRNNDGLLEDRDNRPVRFTILIGAGNTAFERATAFLKSELAKLGIQVDVATLDFNAFVDRFVRGEYDAAYFRGQQSDTDPVSNIDYWLSSGQAHMWNIGQKTPATDWERQIDDLMRRQATTTDQAERKRIFADVQRIFMAHEPIVHFAVPRVYVALSSRVTTATPAVLQPPVLWNAEILAVRPDASSR
jgi:peptide/nickel transport system substrate-binding protein